MIVLHHLTCCLLTVTLTLFSGAACSPMVSEERPRISLGAALEADTSLQAPTTTAIDPPLLPENPEVSEEAKEREVSPYPTVPRTGAPGTTKGTISCGALRCDASTHDCDWDGSKGQWTCLSKTEPSAPDPLDETHYIARCDDASDCADSERCCTHPSDPIGQGRQCMPRGEVDLCAKEVCQNGGTPCPTGTTCDRSRSDTEWSDENGIEGVCRAPEGRATCANKVRCPAAQPVCLLIWKQETPPRCVSRESETMGWMGALKFSCTRQGDCNGEESCMFGMRAQSAFCGRWQRDSGNTLVCDPGGKVPRLPSEAEFQRVCRTDESCREKLRCFPREEFPWLGMLADEPREANFEPPGPPRRGQNARQ